MFYLICVFQTDYWCLLVFSFLNEESKVVSVEVKSWSKREMGVKGGLQHLQVVLPFQEGGKNSQHGAQNKEWKTGILDQTPTIFLAVIWNILFLGLFFDKLKVTLISTSQGYCEG